MVTVLQMANFCISKERLTAVTNHPKVSGAHHYKDLLLTPVVVQGGLLAKELSSTESLGDLGSFRLVSEYLCELEAAWPCPASEWRQAVWWRRRIPLLGQTWTWHATPFLPPAQWPELSHSLQAGLRGVPISVPKKDVSMPDFRFRV